MKLRINKDTLKDIAAAIKSKDVFNDSPIKVKNFSQKISDLNYIDKVVITSGDHLFCYEPWKSICPSLIDHCIVTELSSADSMFAGTAIEELPFNIEFYPGALVNIRNMFGGCRYLKTPPTFITNNNTFSYCQYLFKGCEALERFPDNWGEDLIFTTYYPLDNYPTNNSMFWGCKSLLNLPYKFLDQDAYPYEGAYQTFYQGGFYMCASLPEIIDLPVLTKTSCSDNMFSDTFSYLSSLKTFTFSGKGEAQVRWANQVIDLSTYVGYASSLLSKPKNALYSSDNQVIDEITYQSLKDLEYWWTADAAYSRYNHDSALATINSLPKSSYNGNIIKFKGAAGSKTDAGAINTLTEEEIAIAANKGWTVAFVEDLENE